MLTQEQKRRLLIKWIISRILIIVSYGLIWYYANWQVMLGVFIMHIVDRSERKMFKGL